MRILTRVDFDGVTCVVLLKHVFGKETPVTWIEPNDMDRGKVEIKSGDIIANLPYDPRCALWFDHHVTNKVDRAYKGLFKVAPSAAGVIYEYYKEKLSGFSELVAYTDKIDSANLSPDEIASPEKYPYIILSMSLFGDTRTDSDYLNYIIDALENSDINDILKEDRVKKRIGQFIAQNEKLKAFLLSNTRIQEGVAILDTRGRADAPSGNKFLIYSLFPEVHVSVKVRADKRNDHNDVISIGHSIVNRACHVHAGQLVSAYGGGGHKGAGSCSFDSRKTEAHLKEIVDTLIKNK
jgi:oligoribonuclease NrnB/cAMP/cGMP phosphodiesterase (DHH superfamily)